MSLLALRGLTVRFAQPEGEIVAVRGVDLDVAAGECLAVVGESGSGKSQTFLAALGLLAPNGRATGSACFDGKELIGRTQRELDGLRGRSVGYVFQDALGSLTPHLRIGDQLVEALCAHHPGERHRARHQAVRMLERVQVADAPARLRQYPHELSGGTRQRIALAAALMPRPQLLVADEPTTALDVTVQARVLALFAELRRELGMALVLVTHDLAAATRLADRVAVMYAGRLVEEGSATQVLASPRHPYTAGLLEALPRLDDAPGSPLRSIAGSPPLPGAPVAGCAFHPRCARAAARCASIAPPWVEGEGWRHACHLPLGEQAA